jgi:hypothetical protein
MSTQRGKGNLFPPLQKRIILYLAKHEPLTINEIDKGIRPRNKSSYHATWHAFKSLEKKKLVQKTDVKTYRGREYDLYWLSSAGVFVALVEGADAHDLLQRTIKAYPNDRVLQYCLQIAPFTGTDGYRIALSAILSKGKLEPSDLTMMLTQKGKALSLEQFKQFQEIQGKFPEQREKQKKHIKQLIELLEKMEEMI